MTAKHDDIVDINMAIDEKIEAERQLLIKELYPLVLRLNVTNEAIIRFTLDLIITAYLAANDYDLEKALSQLKYNYIPRVQHGIRLLETEGMQAMEKVLTANPGSDKIHTH